MLKMMRGRSLGLGVQMKVDQAITSTGSATSDLRGEGKVDFEADVPTERRGEK
jgi:hypothetical protein